MRKSVKIDGYNVTGILTGYAVGYQWIVDAHRNENDYMIIANPKKKITLTLKFDKLREGDFKQLIKVMGATSIVHKVNAYDDFNGCYKDYDMYNGDIAYEQKYIGNGDTLYTGIAITLIER